MRRIIVSCIIIQFLVQGSRADPESIEHQPNQSLCTTDDLNHSILVECNQSQCLDSPGSQQEVWPDGNDQVIYMYSTREGERFEVRKLPNLDFEEPEHVRMLDINNTLYVNSVTTSRSHFKGFGTTLNAEKLLASIRDGTYDKNYEPIMRDIFSLSPVGNCFNILRLRLTRSLLLSSNNLADLIAQLDSSARYTIRVIVSLEEVDDGTGLQESLASLARSLKESRNLTCWALVVNREIQFLEDDLIAPVNLTNMFGTDIMLDAIDVAAFKQTPNLSLGQPDEAKRGIFMKTDFSSPYNVLASLKELAGDNDVLTLSGYRKKVVTYGDWQNAQNYAVSILNNLKHGSNGFIEEISETEILADTKGQDSSIYSLRNDHNVHFRGPMYYAIGHFSKHILDGSKVLGIKVQTAPNMFAAHYMAFSVPTKGAVVAIVLNDNEHLLPFRLAIDGKIKIFTDIKAKSFNTFVAKL